MVPVHQLIAELSDDMGLQRSAALTFLDFVSYHVSPRHQMRLNLHLFAITVAPENQCIVYPYSHTRYFRHVSMSKITMR